MKIVKSRGEVDTLAGPSRSFKGRVTLAVASGLLFAAGFPPIPTGVTAFVALVPFLFLLEDLRDWRAVFRWSYLTFLVANAGTIWWVSGWWGDDPWLKAAGVAVNLVHPLLFTFPALAYGTLRRRMGPVFSVTAFPVIWTSWEWLMHLPELSFPWMLLANTQTYDIGAIQFISSTGAFGITLWIATVNALIFHLQRRWMQGQWTLRDRRFTVAVVALVVVLMLPRLHGISVLAGAADRADETIRAAVLQPDVDPYDKWGEGETPMGKLQGLMRLYDSLAAFEPDVALLPETAVPFLLLQPSYDAEYRWLRLHIDSVGVPLLTGFPDAVIYDDPATAPASARKIPNSDLRYQNFNAALLLQPRDPRPQVYHKSRLTPLSERIPYLDALPFLQDALTWGVGISNWGLGEDSTVFALRTGSGPVGIWAMICYETLYPSFVAGFADRGAQVFGVITNDGWFGRSSGPYQLMRYTVLRAIENRRAVARCANNGISCFVDPYGRVSGETELYTRTGIVQDIALRSDVTFYSRHGDWLPLGLTVVMGFFFLFTVVSAYYKR